ncbi:MAG TPA: tetratricopeptide repeat protein [Verrucomicrobiae bacterium]
MRFLVLSVLIATAIVVVAADSKKSTDFRGPKKPATNEVKSSTSTNDPVEAEYLKLLAMDDLAQKEVDVWMKDAQAFQEKGAPQDMAALKEKVQKRLKPVKDAYEKFLAEHPKHSEARLAYGSFLMDTEDEDEAVVQMERAREDDPKNPAAWNNLANHYGHRGPVKRAFQYYEKAIELNPDEPVYKQNFATTVYLFRKDAQEFYRINEQQVFDRALELYQQAMKLDPTNLVLAVDYAQSYYGIKPMRTNDAIAAWNHALTLAKNTDEEQGIFLHLARVELNTAHWNEALVHLNAVTNAQMIELKQRLEKNWIEKRNKALGVTDSDVALRSSLPAKIN